MAKPATRQKDLDQPAIVPLMDAMQADKASGASYEHFFLEFPRCGNGFSQQPKFLCRHNVLTKKGNSYAVPRVANCVT